MSAGLTGDPSITATNWSGKGEYRFWAGDDGKYEVTPAGKVQSRWNNYNVIKAQRDRRGDEWVCTRIDGTTFTFPIATSYIPGQSTFPDNLDLTAQSRLVEKIRGHSFNLAVNVAQSEQLITMVVSNLRRLGLSILSLKRGDFSSAARLLGTKPRVSRLEPSDISGRWLELQYGWLPALSDTFAAAEAYEKLTKKERQTTYRASAKTTSLVECSASPAAYSVLMTVYHKVSIVAELAEELSAPRSLGLIDPLSVAWELVPYSFVVDWFVPIGTYLDTLSVLPFITGRFSTTRSAVTAGMHSHTCLVPLPGNFGGDFCIAVQHSGTDAARGVWAQRIISRGLSPTLPTFDSSGLHGKRIWNALALAYQRFR